MERREKSCRVLSSVSVLCLDVDLFRVGVDTRTEVRLVPYLLEGGLDDGDDEERW